MDEKSFWAFAVGLATAFLLISAADGHEQSAIFHAIGLVLCTVNWANAKKESKA